MENQKKISTNDKILAAAQEIFLLKGFEGSSINDIAQKACINKSLVYHYYKNKQHLWKAVKDHLLLCHINKEESLDSSDAPLCFKEFLTSFVSSRFKFYEQNPSITRLISWQRLEEDQENFQGINSEYINSLATKIQEFQSQGQIQSTFDPQMASYFILTSTSMPFFDQPDFFYQDATKNNKQVYLELIINFLYQALKE